MRNGSTQRRWCKLQPVRRRAVRFSVYRRYRCLSLRYAVCAARRRRALRDRPRPDPDVGRDDTRRINRKAPYSANRDHAIKRKARQLYPVCRGPCATRGACAARCACGPGFRDPGAGRREVSGPELTAHRSVTAVPRPSDRHADRAPPPAMRAGHSRCGGAGNACCASRSSVTNLGAGSRTRSTGHPRQTQARRAACPTATAASLHALRRAAGAHTPSIRHE